MGNIELLIESKLSPLQQDYAIALEKSVDGLIALINNTITFVRADTGRIIIDECKLAYRTVPRNVLIEATEKLITFLK